VLYSVIIFNTYEEKGTLAEVVVVQPNIDPYEEKFSGTPNFIPYKEQFDRLISLSKKEVTDNTEFVLWPETAIPSGYLEDDIESYDLVKQMKAFVAGLKKGALITGMDSYKIYDGPATATANYSENVGYYDSFNSALLITKDTLEIYHKSKLVPGVETIPSFLASLTIDMGGTSGSLGTQETRSVFFNENKLGAAPVICYESIFGQFVSDYVRNGAGFIAIITNDGWWGNTPGHVQHLQYASLRAIETRKSVARSANTGISGFVDQKGVIRNTTKYWETDVRKDQIHINDIITFYVAAGDYIGVAGLSASGVLILMLIFLGIKERIRLKKSAASENTLKV
jgi:apolipoprotein N-acyltransferase